MFRKIVLSFITVVLILGYPVMADAGIDGQVDEFRSQTKCKNVSVVVYDHGEITYYGDSEGLYQIGSMTKSFTGLGVQKLIGKGEIKPDDKVSDLIPGFTSYYGSMSDIDGAIVDTDLVRISRTCFMNVSHLKEIMQIKNSHLEALLDNDEKLIVSRKYLKDIKKIFRRKQL